MMGFLTACSSTSGPKMSQMTEYEAQLNEIEVSYSMPPLGEGSVQVSGLNLNDDAVYDSFHGAIIFFTSWVYKRLIGDNPHTYISLTAHQVVDMDLFDGKVFEDKVTSIVLEHYDQPSIRSYSISPESIEKVESHGRVWLKYLLRSGTREYYYATPISSDKYIVFAIKPRDFLDDYKTLEKSIKQGDEVFRTIKIQL